MNVLKKRLEELERRSGKVGIYPTVCIITAEERGYLLQVQLWNKQTGDIKNNLSKHDTIEDALSSRDRYNPKISTIIIDV